MEKRRKANPHSEFLFNKQLLNSKRSNSHLYFYINNKLPKYKRSQGAIVVSVLIVLIVIVAIMIVWNIVFPLVREKSSEIEIESFITDLDIESAGVTELGSTKVILKRGTGELDGLKFVFYDKDGNSAVEDVYDVGSELETKTYSFNAFENLGKITKIEVYPIVNNKLGIYDESNVLNQLSPYLVLSWNQGEDSFVEGLDFNNNLGISFWVNGNADQILLTQDFEINATNNKIVFSYNNNDFESAGELTNDWNHVVVSVDPEISKIYINNEYSGYFSLASFSSSGNLIIGNVDDLMIFNTSLYEYSVSSLYNTQLR